MRHVLDVGCGRGRDFGSNSHVTGLDVGEIELGENQYLDERIIGDIQTVDLPGAYDLIYCNDVLEHLPEPLVAVRKMCRALAVGGTLELGFPNVLHPKSLVAKTTPHWFHVWVYRRLGSPDAGKPGHGPYPTFLRWSLRPSAVGMAAGEEGVSIVSVTGWASPSFADALGRWRLGWAAWPWRNVPSDYKMVLQRSR